jgi:hypothetical protein
MKKRIAATFLAAGMGVVALASPASAGNGPNARACDGLTNAHNTMIEAQGLDRHLGLQVHQVFSTKLLPSACAG